MVFDQYKSKGERIIADFLESINLPYNYEQGVLIRDRGYQRIWYPDFNLPDFNIYLEYFGREKDPHYDTSIKYKLATYQENNIDIIPVYPETLIADFGSYLSDEIYLSLHSKLTGLERIAGDYNSSRKRYQKSHRNYHRSMRYH